MSKREKGDSKLSKLDSKKSRSNMTGKFRTL